MQLESGAEKTSSPIAAFLYYQKRPVYFLLKLKSIINMRCEGFQSYLACRSGGEAEGDEGVSGVGFLCQRFGGLFPGMVYCL